MSGPMLRVENLSKNFGKHSVLSDVSFSLPEGSSLAVIGPSGCGKSTLLSIVAGLAPADSGSVVLSPQRKTAFILQDYGLFPWKTVRDNLALPLQLQGMGRKERFEAVSAMLKGEYGQSGVFAGVPCIINKNGIQSVLTLSLTDEELDRLAGSCETLRESYRGIL